MKSSNPNSNVSQDQNDISLKDILLSIFDWVKYLLNKKFIIIIFVLLGVGIGILYSIQKKPEYLSRLTFVMEESKSNPLGAYMGLASQFGIDLNSAAGSGVFSGDNILEFLKSRLIIERALLASVIVNNKNSSLADLYLDISGMREEWKDKKSMPVINFPPSQNRSKFSLQQDSVLFIIFNTILKRHLDINKVDKKLSFIEVDCISQSEQFSKQFSEQLVKEAASFYIETKTKRSKENVDKLQAKADSLESLLNRRSYSAATLQDLNQNPARQIATVSLESLQREKMISETMYGEVVKNLELAKITMLQDVPLIQIVDSPILPLEKKKFGKLKGLVLGGFLGGFLTVLCLIVIKLWKDTFK